MNTYSGNLNTDSGKSRKVFRLKPESVFSLFQNRCSDWSRMGVQVEPEYAILLSATPKEPVSLHFGSASIEFLFPRLFTEN
ncbi:MAG: hypothetical protein QX196_02025 [Methylococcaceae bacterium]